MKRFILVIFALLGIMSLVACGKKEEKSISENNHEIVESVVENTNQEQVENQADVENTNQEQTDSNNASVENERQIRDGLKKVFTEIYGTNVWGIRIEGIKVYSKEEEQSNEMISQMNLGENDVAFEISYDIQPAKNADLNMLLAGNGEYDADSGWIENITRVGVLRPNEDETAEEKYIITDFGTGW